MSNRRSSCALSPSDGYEEILSLPGWRQSRNPDRTLQPVRIHIDIPSYIDLHHLISSSSDFERLHNCGFVHHRACCPNAALNFTFAIDLRCRRGSPALRAITPHMTTGIGFPRRAGERVSLRAVEPWSCLKEKWWKVMSPFLEKG